MRDIASLLFGREAGELLNLITGDGGRDREAADRVVRSGEWCGSTPRHGSAEQDVPTPHGWARRNRPRDGRLF